METAGPTTCVLRLYDDVNMSQKGKQVESLKIEATDHGESHQEVEAEDDEMNSIVPGQLARTFSVKITKIYVQTTCF